MEWKDVDWKCLQALRAGFLAHQGADYWDSDKELRHYALAFAPRISAKWRAVWRDLGDRAQIRSILDWGCGTGVASLAFLDAFPDVSPKIRLWDRSSRARAFAAKRLREMGADVEIVDAPPAPQEGEWILASHVWSELPHAVRREFLSLLSQGAGFVWVEPGTPESGTAVVEARESIRDTHRVLGPCPHQERCGLLVPENDRHWCHFFAPPDAEFFTSSDWNRFGREMEIDLRSLPVSYLAAAREGEADLRPRVIGRPRVYKGYAKALVCRPAKVSDETLRATGNQRLKDLRETVFNRRLAD